MKQTIEFTNFYKNETEIVEFTNLEKLVENKEDAEKYLKNVTIEQFEHDLDYTLISIYNYTKDMW